MAYFMINYNLPLIQPARFHLDYNQFARIAPSRYIYRVHTPCADNQLSVMRAFGRIVYAVSIFGKHTLPRRINAASSDPPLTAVAVARNNQIKVIVSRPFYKTQIVFRMMADQDFVPFLSGKPL